VAIHQGKRKEEVEERVKSVSGGRVGSEVKAEQQITHLAKAANEKLH
jgi:hypothetical protein